MRRPCTQPLECVGQLHGLLNVSQVVLAEVDAAHQIPAEHRFGLCGGRTLESQQKELADFFFQAEGAHVHGSRGLRPASGHYPRERRTEKPAP